MIKLHYNSCLVTGGAGFIGSHICEEALAQGKRVVCLDNMVAGKEENIAHLRSDKNFTFVKADVAYLEQILDAFRGVEVVFHNAASKNTVCRQDPHLDMMVNAWGARNVAEACLRHGVKKLVHASTGSVYGALRFSPQDENHPTRPHSFYGVTKLAGEGYLRAYSEYNPGFRYSVIRYFHVYGERQESGEWGGVIPIFIRRAYEGKPLTIYGDGSQVRSFTYVKDDVAANFLLANEKAADGQAYNAASGIRVTVLELARAILKIMDKEHLPIEFADWRPGDIKDFNVDNSAIKSIGGEFHVPFEEGLRKTIDWYVGYFARQA